MLWSASETLLAENEKLSFWSRPRNTASLPESDPLKIEARLCPASLSELSPLSSCSMRSYSSSSSEKSTLPISASTTDTGCDTLSNFWFWVSSGISYRTGFIGGGWIPIGGAAYFRIYLDSVAIFFCSAMSSSIGINPDFLNSLETLFSSILFGWPLCPHVIWTRCPSGIL